MRRIPASYVKFTIFAVLSGLLAIYLGLVLGQFRLGPSKEYHALIADASGLKAGSPVRLAGVEVGRVDDVSLHDGGQGASAIDIRFKVDSDLALPANVQATVRFKNLVGDQYLQLERGAATDQVLRAGATIPATQTKSALDLDTLYSGFQPLFQGLDATQINTISTALSNVLQGQSGAVYQLVDSLGSLFTTLADNDQLIGQVVDNLSTALTSVAQHSDGLGTLVDQLDRLITGLAADRKPIGASLEHINTLAASAASLVQQVRPPLRIDVPALGGLATKLNKDTTQLQYILDNLPAAHTLLSRTGTFSSTFNFLVCGLRFKLTGPDGPVYTPWTFSSLDRCNQP